MASKDTSKGDDKKSASSEDKAKLSAAAPESTTETSTGDTGAAAGTTTPPATDDKSSADSASSGTVLASTDAPVGAPPAPDAPTPAQFLDTVQNKIETNAEEELGIAEFSKELKAAIKEILDSGSTIAKDMVTHLLEYLKHMHPSALVTQETGAARQVAFFRDLMNAINNGEEDFRKMFSIVLAIVHETRADGAFSAHYPFRFLETMKLNSEARTTFQFLVHLLQSTADVKKRSMALKQIDFKRINQRLTPSGAQRLTSFYQV